MRILVINNDGGGFAKQIDVDDGLSVEQLFPQQIPYGRACDYLIRVNRQPTAAAQVLSTGDRVSITPTKIEGATLSHHSPGEREECAATSVLADGLRAARRRHLEAAREVDRWQRCVLLGLLRDAGETEVGGFGATSADDLLLVEDFVLIRQSCTLVSVDLDDEAVADFFDEQVDQGRQPTQFARIWIHTHPGESAEPSGTDEATFARCFGRIDWSVMFILARGGDTSCRLRYHLDPPADLEIASTVTYDCAFDGSDATAWQAEHTQAVRCGHPWSADSDQPPGFYLPFGAEHSVDASAEEVIYDDFIF